MQSITPNLMVKDVFLTISFYKEILGFEVLASVPGDGGNLVFAIIQSGKTMLMFQEENSLKEEYPQLARFSPGGALTLYINVSDVHALYEQIKEKTNVIKEIAKTFYGATEFAIEDCNGYILTFSQKD